MNELLQKIRSRIAASSVVVAGFYKRNRTWVLSGLTIVSILLIIWARLGFTFGIERFFAAQVGQLTVQCGSTQNVLTWTKDDRANSNSIERGNSGTKNLPQCADYWCWLVEAYAQVPTGTTPATYTDTKLQSGVCYEYRVKYRADLPSNTVFCPQNCNQVVTPTPTPTLTSTPTPTTTPSPVACAPQTQTVLSGQAARFQAAGGNGATYLWQSEGQFASGTAISFTYTTVGTKTVTVQSGGTSATCLAVVQSPPIFTPPAAVSLALDLTGRNVSTGGAEGPTVTVYVGQQAEVIARVSNPSTSGNLTNILLRVALPSGFTYVAGSSTANGAPAPDGITDAGLAIGSLGSSQESVVRFRIRAGTGFSVGTTQASLAAVASADAATPQTDQLEIVVIRSGQAGSVQTGPGETVAVSLLASAIVVLLYVSYTRSPIFRRREAETLSRDRGSLDFRKK